MPTEKVRPPGSCTTAAPSRPTWWPTVTPARPRRSPTEQGDGLLGYPATFAYGPASLLTGYAIPSRRGRGMARQFLF